MTSQIRQLRPAEAMDLVKRGEAVVVDVREPDEWAEARIPGARHIPLAQVLDRADELPTDRLVILQCRSGNRSQMAAEALVETGHEQVANLAGGIGAWARAGLPVEA